MTDSTIQAEPESLVSIVIPSYKRPDDLQRCLEAIQAQDLKSFEALIVCRPDDAATRNCVAGFATKDDRFSEALVKDPGLIVALNVGLKAANGQFVTFTDDDAEAPSHWLTTLVTHFDLHPECGAVGGQDRLQLNVDWLSNPPIAKKVGRFTWSGKFHGNHHCPIKPPFLQTEMLKGVNMTYRHELIRGLSIGEGLRGGGAQVGTEACLAHSVLSKGYDMHFVRDAWVKHHVGERTENDNRTDFTTQFAYDTTYNNHYTLARYKGGLRWMTALLRALLLGTKRIPGLARTLPKGRVPELLKLHWQYMFAGGRRGLKRARNNQGSD